VWQEPDYRIYICRVTKSGNNEHLYGRTDTWSVSPSVDILPFGVTIPASAPQRAEIPEGLMNYPVQPPTTRPVIRLSQPRYCHNLGKKETCYIDETMAPT
jgi:hypothetical protein